MPILTQALAICAAEKIDFVDATVLAIARHNGGICKNSTKISSERYIMGSVSASRFLAGRNCARLLRPMAARLHALHQITVR